MQLLGVLFVVAGMTLIISSVGLWFFFASQLNRAELNEPTIGDLS